MLGNAEFTDALCTETWRVENGTVSVVNNRRAMKKEKSTVSVFLKYSGSTNNMTRASSRSSLAGASDNSDGTPEYAHCIALWRVLSLHFMKVQPRRAGSETVGPLLDLRRLAAIF